MTHPRLQNLTLEHGQIFRKRGLINEPYMQTPAIQVSSRLNFEQLTESKWLFNFHLNNSPDEIWKEILGSRLGNVQFGVEANIPAFTDIPTNLQSRLATIASKRRLPNLIASMKRNDRA
jgi:hypothetical protein